jgi:DNA ligase-1
MSENLFPTPFTVLVETGEALEATRSRLRLAEVLAGFLQRLAPEEVGPGLRLLLGQPFAEWEGRALNVSGQQLFGVLDEMAPATPEQREAISAEAVDGGHAALLLLERARAAERHGPPLAVCEVMETLEAIAAVSGKGARARREALLRELLAGATPLEAKYIAKAVLGEMRHGVSGGIAQDGIARAAGVPVDAVRRADQLLGDLREVATLARQEGAAGLARVTLRLFRPVRPMLAQTADSMADIFRRLGGRVALEFKYDGARVQIHVQGDEVRVFSRNLADVTASLPDVAAKVRAHVRARPAIVEGEVVAVDAEGRPLPFQELMRRFRRVHDVAEMVAQVPVEFYLFDCLHRAGEDLLDHPYHERWAALEDVSGGLPQARRCLPADEAAGQAFAEEARECGHEGVMAKDLESLYTPGARGMSWLKLKHVLTLDLAVVAADWGYGRRHGWLSNLHLAVRDEETGEFVVVGKTFKGLTDAQFVEMTARLLALERGRRGGTVYVEPGVVVEVLFNELQASPRYRGGLALRFARVLRIREDKGPDQVDTLKTLRQLYERQFRYKGRNARV